MKKILFSRESDCLQPLLSLIEKQKHMTLVLWALEYAEELADKFEEKYPIEPRPRQAVYSCRAWARGEIKMPDAKKAIHAAHNAASEISDDIVYCSIARAIGQSVSTVHVETHAIGGPIYALTALVYECGHEEAETVVAKECARLYERLQYWESNTDSVDIPWAKFLLKDDIPNKEKMLREKIMRRYIALLRGVNVGGKNKISMRQLKSGLEDSGLIDVTTYINSGNVIFFSRINNEGSLKRKCESVIADKFKLNISVAIISAEDFSEAVSNAPKWWDNDCESKHNAIFIINPSIAEEVIKEAGEPKEGYEQIAAYGQVIFWSAPLKTFSRTRWSKISGTPVYDKITIRNANTTKKLLQLVKEGKI